MVLTPRPILPWLLFFAGCGGAQSDGPPSLPRRVSTGAAAPPGVEGPPALAALKITDVPSGTAGPYVGRRQGALLALWAAQSADAGRSWYAISLGPRGEPQGDVHRVGAAPADLGLATLKPLGTADPGGFILVATTVEFSGVRVEVTALGPRGELSSGPTPLAQSLPDVVWVDAVPTAKGALALWAIKKDDRAALFAAAIGTRAQVEQPAALALADVRAWQVVGTPTGAAIAAVHAGKNRGEGGPVALVYVNEQGRPDGKPVVLQAAPTAEPDVDLVKLGSHLVVAWSDRLDIEPRLVAAVVDKSAVVKAAAPLTEPFGPQHLIRLVPPQNDGPAFIAWENLVERPDSGRLLRAAEVRRDGALEGAQALLDHAAEDGSVPDLAATANGLAVLTRARACFRSVACPTAEVVPTFVQLDRSLDAVVSEPLRLEPLGGLAAPIGWALTCGRFECFALATLLGPQAPVYTVQLGGASNAWAPAARRYVAPAPPHPVTVSAVGQSDTVSDLSAIATGDATLLAWVTYFDPSIPYVKPDKPAPDGRQAPVRALLRVRSLPTTGRAKDPVVISYRASSDGGVALAPGDATRRESLLVWTAVEGKDPQVFITLLGPNGEKRRQRMLTRRSGGLRDVAVGRAGDGWVIGWIDERKGHAEVCVTRVNDRLETTAPERFLSHAVSNSSQVRLLPRGDHVMVVWSDARGGEQANADLFTARIGAKDVAPVGSEQQLTRSPTHSHSPVVAPLGDGAAVAWVEESPRPDQAGARVLLQRVDSGAEAASEPVVLPLQGTPRTLDLSCNAGRCRLVAVVSAEARSELVALEWAPGGERAPVRLAALSARPHESTAPVQLGDEVFYADAEPGDGARVYRMQVAWP